MDEVIQRLRRRQSSFDDSNDQCFSYAYGYYDCYSNWNTWGRWVFVACIIAAFLILFALCAFLARRRRRAGLQPYYGTAWMPFRPQQPNDGHPFQPYPHQDYYGGTTAPPPPGYTPMVNPQYPQQQQQSPVYAMPGSPHQQHGSMYGRPPAQSPDHGVVFGNGADPYNVGPPPGPPPRAHIEGKQ